MRPGYPRTSDGKIHELDNSSLVYNRLYPEERKFGDFIKRTNAELIDTWYLRAAMDTYSFATVRPIPEIDQVAESLRELGMIQFVTEECRKHDQVLNAESWDLSIKQAKCFWN